MAGTSTGRPLITPAGTSPPTTARMAPEGSGPSTPRSMASITLGPNTIPSSSEFEARRLAPWTPVQLTSPAAQSPGRLVAPWRSVTTPPHW